MAILGTFYKQPGETLDYDIDAKDWLAKDDIIESVSAVVTPSGLTIQNTSVLTGGKGVKVWLTGGTNGIKYKIDVTMTTEDSRIKEAEFIVKVKEV